MSLKRSILLFGTALITASLVIPGLPRISTAQGILPPFQFGDGPAMRQLPFGLNRRVKSARSARYQFKVPANQQTPIIRRLIITEVTNNFMQKGGRFKLDKVEIRSCSDLGNVLRRPNCEETIPIKQILLCSSTRGCESYDSVTEELTKTDESYEGLSYIEIEPMEAIAANEENLIVVFSDVKNPRSPVSYQFNLAVETLPGRINRCQIITTLGHCALGTWLVDIEDSED